MIDWWQLLFLIAATSLVLFQVVRGWQRGLVRQIFSLFALGLAYLSVWWRHAMFTPFFKLFGLPEIVANILSGILLGVSVYGIVSLTGSVVLKRTSHQSLLALRLVYGSGGAFIGLLFGLFMTWIALIGVRLLGTVAETEIFAATRRASIVASDETKVSEPEVSSLVRSLASLKKSMDQGQAGEFAKAVDPLPDKVYMTLTQVAMLISDPESVDRFLAYPGAKTITSHPKMVALTEDEKITEDLNARNYFALLRNPHIVEAANDPELASLVARFELDKALKHALNPDLQADLREAVLPGPKQD